jgi:hypothetical protein
MANEYSLIENLLGLEVGSTNGATPDEITPVLADGVKNKTNELVERLDTTSALSNVPKTELVKSGISLDSLEVDRGLIRNESFEVYRIGKAILTKLYDDIEGQIDVTDRMYASCAKMLDSVNGSLSKLFDMNQKFKQEEEMKGLALMNDLDDDSSLTMTPDQWMDFAEASIEDEDEVIPIIPEKD